MTSGHPRRDVLHPLSAHAVDVLRGLAREDRPASEINAGVLDRFTREGLIGYVDKLHRGLVRPRVVTFATITDAGRVKLAQLRT